MKLMYVQALLRNDESLSRLSLHTHYRHQKYSHFSTALLLLPHTTCIFSRKGLFQSFGVSLATRALSSIGEHSTFFWVYVCMYWGQGFGQTWEWEIPIYQIGQYHEIPQVVEVITNVVLGLSRAAQPRVIILILHK